MLRTWLGNIVHETFIGATLLAKVPELRIGLRTGNANQAVA
jgi:hypothetical protein